MRHLPLVCLLLLAFALPAVADDGPAVAEKKVQSFSAVADSWPAPSADKAFEINLVVILGESPVGEYTVSAAPNLVDGKVVGWRVGERLALELGGDTAEGVKTIDVGPDLTPMAGDATENFGGTPKKQTFSVKDGVATIVTKEGDAEATTKEAKVASWMLPGKIGLFMAARFLPNKAASFKGMNFSHTDDDGVTAEFTLDVDPEARFEGRKVMALRGDRRKERMEFLIDPETRDILRVRMTKTDSAMVMTMKPKVELPSKPEPKGATKPLFEREPQTPAEVSAHVLYAVTVKDRDLIEKWFRWQTMYDVTKKQLEGAGQEAPSFEAWKKQTLDSMAGGPKNDQATPVQVKAALAMYVSKVQQQDTPQGWKAVVWPKDFAHILVVLEKKDDVWRAIGMRNLGG